MKDLEVWSCALLIAFWIFLQVAKELRELRLEAIIHHNDCLYLAHESLALVYQVQGSLSSLQFFICDVAVAGLCLQCKFQ